MSCITVFITALLATLLLNVNALPYDAMEGLPKSVLPSETDGLTPKKLDELLTALQLLEDMRNSTKNIHLPWTLDQVQKYEAAVDKLEVSLGWKNQTRTDIKSRMKREVEQDNSHWCCKVNLYGQSATRMITKAFLLERQISSEEEYSCGFLKLYTCTRTILTPQTIVEYGQVSEPYEIPPEACPDDKITCCKDYIRTLPFTDNCLTQEQLDAYLDALARLQEMGLL